jgi:hypothetical protein
MVSKKVSKNEQAIKVALEDDGREGSDKEDYISSTVPFWRFTDLDDDLVSKSFIAFRLFQALFLSYNLAHPDEYWQAIEPAYNMVFGGV